MNFYTIARACLGGFFRFIYNIKIIGRENEPTDGAFMVCANHTSNRDVIVVGASFKRQVHFFAKAELFKIPILRHFIKALGAFPVDRQNASASLGPIKMTLSLLEEGKTVGIFPQGTRCPSVDPRETVIKNGVGMIEYHAKVKVVPVLIKTKKWKVVPFRRTYVIIGKPIEYGSFDFANGRGVEFAAASKKIFSSITDLIDTPCGKEKSKKVKDE